LAKAEIRGSVISLSTKIPKKHFISNKQVSHAFRGATLAKLMLQAGVFIPELTFAVTQADILSFGPRWFFL
jgi:hypothetical protein